MSLVKFATVIVIGFGKIAQDVASTLLFYDVKLKLLQTEKYPFSIFELFAKKHNVTYQFKSNKEEITNLLHDWLSGETLIISANNNYIFKKQLLALSNVTIINFHNALLPNLRGRNAPSWAIYHKLKKTGITWHYVGERIDTGGAIAFSEVLIDEHDKAYQVAHKCMQAGIDSFTNIIGELLETKFVRCLAKKTLEHDYLYRSKEIPGNGLIDTVNSTIENYRILRALDYGAFKIFPPAQIKSINTYYLVRAYQFINEPSVKAIKKYENSIVLSDEFGLLKL